MKKSVTDVELTSRKVLLRADLNVPMKNGEITNDNRIVEALPTIKHILDAGGKLILFSHLGKVKTEEDLQDESMRPVADRLSEVLSTDVVFVEATRGDELEDAISELKDGNVLMFENTRFEDLDGKKESSNDPELGKYWASLGDVFVNDAFGTAHRSHASNVGIAAHLETVSGFLMKKEIDFIGGAVDNPERPFVAILGGAKVSDKIGVIENLLNTADKVLIGGGMMFTFLKAQDYEIGTSLLEEDKVDLAKSLLEKGGDKLVLPVDAVVASEFKDDDDHKTVKIDEIPEDMMGLDVGPETVALFKETLNGAKTVVWNGPMGVFEMKNFAQGTIGVCESIAALDDATTIIGGGDSAAAAHDLGFADQFSHISTGGGASLEYLEGKALPGLESISDK